MTVVALILGGAKSVWDDLERAKALTAGLETIIVAANFAGMFYDGDIDAWATLHPEALAGWRAARADRGGNADYRAFVHANRRNTGGAEVWPMEWSGSSGLYAAQVAVQAMGAAGVILCGVPMEIEAGHFHEAGNWPLVEKYKPAFLAAKEAGIPLRSMSGWTLEQFGEPDADWLASLHLGPAMERPARPKEAIMRIKMLKTRSFTPPEERRITVKYIRNEEYTVKRDWGRAMIKDGDAEEVKAPARDPLDHDGDGVKGGSAPKAD